MGEQFVVVIWWLPEVLCLGRSLGNREPRLRLASANPHPSCFTLCKGSRSTSTAGGHHWIKSAGLGEDWAQHPQSLSQWQSLRDVFGSFTLVQLHLSVSVSVITWGSVCSAACVTRFGVVAAWLPRCLCRCLDVAPLYEEMILWVCSCFWVCHVLEDLLRKCLTLMSFSFRLCALFSVCAQMWVTVVVM